MDTAGKPSTGAAVTCIGVGAVALLFWVMSVAILSDLGRSDAAGNAMGGAYAAIALCILYFTVGVLTIVALIAGVMPRWAKAAFVILVVASGTAAFVALNLLTHPSAPPYKWPLVAPALAPPLAVLFCVGGVVPPSFVSLRAMAAATLGLLLLASASIVPMVQIRNTFVDGVVQVRANYERDLAALPKDAPLWDRVRFLDTPSEVQQEAVLDAIKALPNRQAEAEIMLERGDFPLNYLGRMDLTVTPVVCEKSRVLLRKQVEPLVLKNGEKKAYRVIFLDVSSSLAAMHWLDRNNCDIAAEARAWEAMANAYTDTNYDVYELRDLGLKKAQ